MEVPILFNTKELMPLGLDFLGFILSMYLRMSFEDTGKRATEVGGPRKTTVEGTAG